MPVGWPEQCVRRRKKRSGNEVIALGGMGGSGRVCRELGRGKECGRWAEG